MSFKVGSSTSLIKDISLTGHKKIPVKLSKESTIEKPLNIEDFLNMTKGARIEKPKIIEVARYLPRLPGGKNFKPKPTGWLADNTFYSITAYNNAKGTTGSNNPCKTSWFKAVYKIGKGMICKNPFKEMLPFLSDN